MTREKLAVHAVILAGGRGTRFWPLSRTKTPKQLLNIVGKGTMLQQTVARLKGIVPAERIWTVTNEEQATEVRRQLPAASRRQVLVEPVGRNTAAAIALAAVHIRAAAKGDAVMAVLPADHFIAKADEYRRIIAAAFGVAREPGRMVVLGIPPTRPETGFGYVEHTEENIGSVGMPVYGVRRFTEKPALEKAKEYVAAGTYHWNAGMFFWRVSTYLDAMKRHLPATERLLEQLAVTIGARKNAAQLRKLYPKLENISVDYAILERVTAQPGERQVYVVPAEIGWSDIGSWEAVYELKAKAEGENVAEGSAYFADAKGNLISCGGKFVAAIGVDDLVVVDTSDALLICRRSRAQDVGKLVKWLDEKRFKKLI